uniref:N-acetyltransferase domain-containing protein n=1 Tax=Chaetoceros debilis TaxID=122233 RepID=A0A7S3VDU6_9STRA|mmetsp:Transcript_29489/g.45012  ORF Transcript_29489/g.45012 Transcript_29489/m.45012 type:complete len:254 (+) Transcript_29489:100-861(+)
MIFCSKGKKLPNDILIKELLQSQYDLSVKLLDKSHENEMVETTSDAFSEDPMMQWIANIPESNQDKIGSILELNRWLNLGLNKSSLRQKKGVMFGVTEGGQMAGAMSVIPSSQQPLGLFSWILYVMFQGGVPPYEKNKAKYGKWAGKRIESMDILTKKRKAIMKPYPKHIYLQQIGVRKEFQGKGIGKKLYKTLFAAADSLQVPVYLETESEENVSLYQHFGFQTVETVLLSAKGDTSDEAKFKMWLMLRHPF